MGFTPSFVPSMETLKQSRKLLQRWLSARLPEADAKWLEEEAEGARTGPEKRLFMAFSAAGRHAPKTPLALKAAEARAAEQVRPGWQPGAWTVEQAARTYLALQRDSRDRARWLHEVEMLFEHADLGELVALYQALPVLPNPDALVDRAAEGIRSNMTDVFSAVALRNPYPAENLADAAWNQMVLKALFVEVGLSGVVGLVERGNPALARMLCDYARERWAAGRPVSPDLWICVGPHADSRCVEDLEKALTTGDEATKAAVTTALRACPWPEASYVLTRHGLLREDDLP